MTGPGGAFGSGDLTGPDGTIGLLGMLAEWLPHQRWFPGRGTRVSKLSLVSDVTLRTGDPALRHLIVEAVLPGGPARFQVLVGCRRDLPDGLAGAVIGRHLGWACYDAPHDPALAGLPARVNTRAARGRPCALRREATRAVAHRPRAGNARSGPRRPPARRGAK